MEHPHFQSDPVHLARERKKARILRESQWWKQKIASGFCHYCSQRVARELLTMDHILPLGRGGKSTKGNIVAACKECNNNKKWMTPAEIILFDQTLK